MSSFVDIILKRLVKRALRLIEADEKQGARAGKKKEKGRVPKGVSLSDSAVIHESAVFRHLSKAPDAIRLGDFTHLR